MSAKRKTLFCKPGSAGYHSVGRLLACVIVASIAYDPAPAVIVEKPLTTHAKPRSSRLPPKWSDGEQKARAALFLFGALDVELVQQTSIDKTWLLCALVLQAIVFVVFLADRSPSPSRPLSWTVEETVTQESLLGAGMPLLTTASEAAEARLASVRRDGVLCVSRALSSETAIELREFVMAELARTQREAAKDPSLVDDRLCNVQTPRAGDNLPQTRWELKLPLAAVVECALRELLSEGSLGAVIEALTESKDAELRELTALISMPGAAPQGIHEDTPFSKEPGYFTIFVALQDVKLDMGPTRFLLGTHVDREAHEFFKADWRAFLDGADSHVALLEAGDATVYDSRLLHCGTRNFSDSTRVLLCLTFCHAKYQGTRLSVRAGDTSTFSLSDFT